jgi:hypothetical protein
MSQAAITKLVISRPYILDVLGSCILFHGCSPRLQGDIEFSDLMDDMEVHETQCEYLYRGLSEPMREYIDMAEAFRDDIESAQHDWEKWFNNEWDMTETIWHDGDRYCEVSHITGNMRIVNCTSDN